MEKILAWFSCGATSAVACKLAIEKYGADNVLPVYIEIKSAHPDNDRFIADCERWMGRDVVRIGNPKGFADQFEVIEKTRFINGPMGAACTHRLKKMARYSFQESQPFAHQIFGFEFDKKEVNRAIRFKQQYPETKPLFPLIARRINKRHCLELLLRNGIAIPKMYELGYHNNNCIGCVKGGKGYWNKIRLDFPAYFQRMAEMERKVGASCLKQRVKIGENDEGDAIYESRKLYLDELHPDDGRHEMPILPDCGTFCEVEFADIIDPITEDIMEGSHAAGQLHLF